MDVASGRRWWGIGAAAGAALLLCGLTGSPAQAQTATAPGNSSANPGTTPPQAGPGARLDLQANTPGATADSAASSLSAPAQTGNAAPHPVDEPHPVDSSGPVVRSIFDETDVSDEHPVGEPADVGSSFDRQDSVNDHPVP